jgi:DNA gyrase subunit B
MQVESLGAVVIKYHPVSMALVRASSMHFRQNLLPKLSRDGQLYHMEFEQGIIKGQLQKLGKTDRPQGTTITFYPDPTIFKESTEFDYKWVVNYLRHQAYLTKGVYVSVNDERTNERQAFYFDGGIQSYVKHLNIGKDVLSANIFYVEN